MAMSVSSDRRRARRLDAALPVTVTLNGGTPELCETINFTYRSLAVRTALAAQEGDEVTAVIDGLPKLEGYVVRVFDKGFAVRLNEISIALVASVTAKSPRLTYSDAAAVISSRRVISPMFTIDASTPSWGRFTASRLPRDANERHMLSIVTTEIIEPSDIESVWVSIDETRWVARLRQARRRGAQSIVIVLLNEWQFGMAADHGLSVSITRREATPWTATVAADSVYNHLLALRPEMTALSA